MPIGTKFDLRMTSDNRVEILVPERMIGELIGKNGANIKRLEENRHQDRCQGGRGKG